MTSKVLPCVLTIAGSDSGGGAGIQADIKSFQERDVFGTSVITAVTAQNTTGVQGVFPLETKAIEQQLDSIGEDFQISALKTGMLFDASTIALVVDAIKKFSWENLVVDPVMVSTTGHILLEHEAIETIKSQLLPLARIVTPNIPEAEHLTKIKIDKDTDIIRASEKILSMGSHSVLIKGGHSRSEIAEDIYMDQTGSLIRLRSRRLETKNTHGTGCTFSAVLAAELAKGREMEEALMTAKRFIQAAIENTIPLGHGHGPTYHAAYRHHGIKEDVRCDHETVNLLYHGNK